MNDVLKISAGRNSMVIFCCCMIALLSWGALLKWIIYGQFFERPIIPVIFGGLFFLVAHYFHLESKAYVVFDPSGTGEARSFVRYGRKMREYKYQGLEKIQSICVYCDSDGGENKQYLLFKNGYELHLPCGQRVEDLTKKWFKEQYSIDLKVTYLNHLGDLWDGMFHK